MKSLVTGATGFLGSAVMHSLLKAGHDVRLLVRANSDRRNIDKLPVEIAEGDLRDHQSLEAAVKGCDYLYHVAADYRLWVPDPQTMYAINVQGTKALIIAAANAGLKRIVYTSSVAALGLTSDGTPADETTPSSLEYINGHYKRSKYIAEQTVKELTDQHRLPLVIVNPSAPIGPRDIRPTPTGRIVLDVMHDKMPAYVNTGLNIAHVDDIAHGHLLACERGKTGERYILGGDNMTLLKILETLDDILGQRKRRAALPINLMFPIAWVMEKIALITHKEPRATIDSLRMAKKLMYFTSDKAIHDLGYQFRPARLALEDAVKWYRDNGYV
ncbi:hopanoid-associated sugar epimerase [Nitrosomonas sp.]|uniref:hopanoid-associated sugar epimerase n=1 Tax=Nitrosomonas sp. TaxID=42353 RepID=UPI002846D4EA|nr:hopanoid-associated sugar epimerase [Nitrosomonas sp.]MDR4515136.1 NAD-dependent epimerase/dehydratase family protein [Nitrosomonas sp.]